MVKSGRNEPRIAGTRARAMEFTNSTGSTPQLVELFMIRVQDVHESRTFARSTNRTVFQFAINYAFGKGKLRHTSRGRRRRRLSSSPSHILAIYWHWHRHHTTQGGESVTNGQRKVIGSGRCVRCARDELDIVDYFIDLAGRRLGQSRCNSATSDAFCTLSTVLVRCSGYCVVCWKL